MVIKDLVMSAARAGTELAIDAADPSGLGGKILSMTLGRLDERDANRARKLYAELKPDGLADEEFTAQLHRQMLESDEVLTIFRTLLVASVEAMSLEAVACMARVGRRYLAGQCPQWLARGLVRLLSEISDPELGALREISEAHRSQPHQAGSLQLTIGLAILDGPFLRRNVAGSRDFAHGHGLRLAGLLERHGLTTNHVLEHGNTTVLNAQSVYVDAPVATELAIAVLGEPLPT